MTCLFCRDKESDICFADVSADNAGECIHYLDQVQFLPRVKALKRRTYDLLELSSGEAVVDIGCGTGVDVVHLAGLVGQEGKVVGLDNSVAMVAEARMRATGVPNVSFIHADILELDIDIGLFNAAKVDRLLHFLHCPEVALQRISTLLHVDGRIVISEPDWASLTVQGGEETLSAKILRCLPDGPEGNTGQNLAVLCQQNNYEVQTFFSETLTLDDFAQSKLIFQLPSLARRAIHLQAITQKEAMLWMDSLALAHEQKTFSGSLSGFTVLASKRVV